MPVQWSGSLTSAEQLAGVIQGEAGSNPAAQFAVASVIYNRLQSGNFGSDISQVVTPTQFNGYATPNSNALSLAQAIYSGQAPPGGSTGNALYFAAPYYGDSTSSTTRNFISSITGSGTNIGGNYFSDQFGAPSANFQPPSYGAGATSASAGSTSAPTDATTGSGLAGNAASPLAGLQAIGGQVGSAISGALGLSAGSISSALGGAGGAANSLTGGGVPITITDAPSVGTQSAQTVAKSVGNLTSGLSADTASAEKSGTSWIDAVEQGAVDLTVRGGLILLAIVLLISAFVLLSNKGARVEIAAVV